MTEKRIENIRLAHTIGSIVFILFIVVELFNILFVFDSYSLERFVLIFNVVSLLCFSLNFANNEYKKLSKKDTLGQEAENVK